MGKRADGHSIVQDLGCLSRRFGTTSGGRMGDRNFAERGHERGTSNGRHRWYS